LDRFTEGLESPPVIILCDLLLNSFFNKRIAFERSFVRGLLWRATLPAGCVRVLADVLPTQATSKDGSPNKRHDRDGSCHDGRPLLCRIFTLESEFLGMEVGSIKSLRFRLGESGVFAEDVLHFIECEWALVGAVSGWDDEFGGGSFLMRTPVFDDAVGAVRGVAFAAVADDGVIDHTLFVGGFGECQGGRGIGTQRLDGSDFLSNVELEVPR